MSADYKKLQRARAIAEGKCSRCCSRPAMKNRKYCKVCYEKVNPGYSPPKSGTCRKCGKYRLNIKRHLLRVHTRETRRAGGLVDKSPLPPAGSKPIGLSGRAGCSSPTKHGRRTQHSKDD